MPVLPSVDLIDIDDQLNDSEVDIRDTVQRFAEDELIPHISEWFDHGAVPREVLPELGKLGVLGMHLSGYGCAGTNAVSYGLACLELEAVDSGLRSLVSVQGSLAMFALHEFGSEEQKSAWLPQMTAGHAIGCFGLTEPDIGSNPAAMRTTARRDGSDWIISGTKTWITNGGIADIAVIWARTPEGIAGFAVERGLAGFTTRDIPRKMSLRASVTSELTLDEVRVPDSARLPGAQGLSAPLRCLQEARFGIVWGSLGAARSCWTTARDYAVSRIQFDKPIAAFQLTQNKLVSMAMEWNKGALLALHLGRLKDRGALTPQQVSLGKLNNVRESMEICRESRTILGANGITLDYPIMRHMNNLESVLTYEGTSEVHTLVLGQHFTGLPAFR